MSVIYFASTALPEISVGDTCYYCNLIKYVTQNFIDRQR